MKLFTMIIMILALFSLPLFGGGGKDITSGTEPFSDFTNIEDAMMQAESMPTVLFFYADWCPSCRSARKDFTDNPEKLEGISLLVVDYDNSESLKKRYGVTYQHTFVQISKSGDMLAKWNGGGAEELAGSIVRMEM